MTAPAVCALGKVRSSAGRPSGPAPFNVVGVDLPDSWGFGDIVAAARELGCRSVYVLGGELLEFPEGVVVTGGDPAMPWRLTVPGETYAHLCGPGAPGRVGTSPVSVVLLANCEDGSAGPFDALAPHELVMAFREFERLVGVPWADGVGHTAERLIRSTHPPAKGGTPLDKTDVCPDPVKVRNLEQPWQAWRRELTYDELGAPYVHAFDANAQYLGAWGTAEFGHGAPVHLRTPRFDARQAGVWRLEGVPTSVPAGELLPLPWTPGREWFTTPTVARMLEVCAGMEAPLIYEAWVWPRKSRYLHKAAERLRDARAAAIRDTEAARLAIGDAASSEDALRLVSRLVVADVVLDAVKELYRRETGRFLSGGTDPRTGFARPDWGHTIQAMARVNLHRRLSSLGAAPFAIATDGLLFASDEIDGRVFAEKIRLPVGDGLGQFSYDGSAPAGPVRDALEVAGRSLGSVFAAVRDNKIGES